jgi:hypothetical protein
MEKMYFHARSLGIRMLTVGCRALFCSSSGFPGTFHTFTHRVLQDRDDDYLILPEVVQTLHTRITVCLLCINFPLTNAYPATSGPCTLVT